MRVRTKAREIALCVLYEIEIAQRDFSDLLNTYFDKFPQKQEAKPFSTQLLDGITHNLPYLDSVVKKHVKNWEISRMAIIDRNILRMASYELLFIEDIPPKVSINEAVELAKKFGDIDSPRFVNGILDKVYKIESKKQLP